MEFKYQETTLVENENNNLMDHNSYYIISRDEKVSEEDFEDVIKIIDESGQEVNCTYDKFVEIFDEEGLSGFIV